MELGFKPQGGMNVPALALNHKPASLAPLLAESQRLFHLVNDTHYNGALPDPVIVIASNGRLKNRLGWCTVDKIWTDRADEERFEIGLAAEHLHRPPEDTCCTLLHEFAHYFNFFNGVKDCNPRTQYHNQSFKAEAERLGLIVTQDPKRGWAVTTVGDEARALLTKAQLDPTAFDWARIAFDAAPKKQPTKMVKWRCGCTNIRAAVQLNAVCQTCNQPFACAAPKAPPAEAEPKPD